MAVNCPRKTIEGEPGTVENSLDLMSDPVPSKMEEGDHVPLTYADLKRWLRLLVLLILAAYLAWVLKPILLLFAVVILLAMMLNPVIAPLERKGIKRGLAVLLLAVIFVGVLALVFWLLTQACESAITALWQGARSPGKFPDHEILPDEHGRPCGDLDGWGELMPAGASPENCGRWYTNM